MKETRGGGEFAELMERAVLKERVRVRGGSAGLKERRGEDGLRQGGIQRTKVGRSSSHRSRGPSIPI